MTTIPNWLLVMLLCLAGIGASVIAFGSWLLLDELYVEPKRRKRRQDIEYKSLHDGIMAEIESTLRGK